MTRADVGMTKVAMIWFVRRAARRKTGLWCRTAVCVLAEPELTRRPCSLADSWQREHNWPCVWPCVCPSSPASCHGPRPKWRQLAAAAAARLTLKPRHRGGYKMWPHQIRTLLNPPANRPSSPLKFTAAANNTRDAKNQVTQRLTVSKSTIKHTHYRLKESWGTLACG